MVVGGGGCGSGWCEWVVVVLVGGRCGSVNSVWW